ncbi:hypothetical protein M3Y95_01204700 [Aphelenchoides besseyi]|nr:hypothetical protein M3Y95_01204700 [Aphelenchoides besseyi]
MKQLYEFNTLERIHSDSNFCRFLLINRKFLSLFAGSINENETHSLSLSPDFGHWTLRTDNNKRLFLVLYLSTAPTCVFIRLSNLKLLTLYVAFCVVLHPLTGKEFRDVQRLCNAISDNPMIKGIKVGSAYCPEIQRLLYDQLPDRIVDIVCKARDSVTILSRNCLMDSVEIRAAGLKHISFTHVLQLHTRKFQFVYDTIGELANSLPLKRNESIETIEMTLDIYTDDCELQHHFAEAFRTLRTINDKLKLQLKFWFIAHEEKDNDEIRETFQEDLLVVKGLVDRAVIAQLPIETFSINFEDYSLDVVNDKPARWKDISELCDFFTSQGFVEDVEETQKMSREWDWNRCFSTVYMDTKILTYTLRERP